MAEMEAESNSLTDESELSEGEVWKRRTQVAVKQVQSERSSSPVGNEARKKAEEFDKVVEWLRHLENLPENSNSNEVAVVLEGFPLVKITKLEAEELESVIRQRINLSEHKESVQFISVRHENGAIIFNCANEITKMWLKQTVPEMKAWMNSKLEVGPADILVHGVKFVLWVSKKGTDEILNLLDTRNNGISTSEWTVTEREDSDRKTKLVVWVDNKAFNVLKSRKLILSFSPCLITFKPLLQLDQLKKLTGLRKFTTELPGLRKSDSVKRGTTKLAVVNPSQCSVKIPNNIIDIPRSCDLRYWLSAQLEAPQNRIAAETSSHNTDRIDNNCNKHGNITQSFSASSRLIASDSGHIYGLDKATSREPTFQDSDVAGSHKLNFGSLNNNLPHSLARRLGDSGRAHSRERRLGDSGRARSRERRLGASDRDRSRERRLGDLDRDRSRERRLGDSDRARSRERRLGDSDRARSRERRLGDSDRARSRERRLGDSDRARSRERRLGDSDRTPSRERRLGDSDRTRSRERRLGDSDRTRSRERRLGDSGRTRSRERRLGDSDRARSRERRLGDSDRARSLERRLGVSDRARSLERRLGDSDLARSCERRLGDSDSVHSRDWRLRGSDTARSNERRFGDLDCARSNERRFGDSDRARSREGRLGDSDRLSSRERRLGASDRARSRERRLGDSERSRSFERRFGNFDCARSHERILGDFTRASSHERLGDLNPHDRRLRNLNRASSHERRLGDSDRARSRERRFQDSDRSSGHTRSRERGLGVLDRDRSRERRLGDSGHARSREGRLLDLDHVSSRDKTVSGTGLRHSLGNSFGASLLGKSCEPEITNSLLGDTHGAHTNASVISGGVPNTTRKSRFDQDVSHAASFGGTAVPQSANFGDWRGIKSSSTQQSAQMSTTGFSHLDNTSSLLLGTGNKVITSSSSKGLSDLGQTHSRDVGFTDSNLTRYQSSGFGNSDLGQSRAPGSGSIGQDHAHLTGTSDSDSLLAPVLTHVERARLRAAAIEDSKFRGISASGLGESNDGHLRLDMFRETALSRLRAAGLSVSDLALLLVAGFPESEMSRFLARGFPESDLTELLAAKFSASGPAHLQTAASAESDTMHTRAAIFGKSSQETRLEMTGPRECDWGRSHVSDLVKSESGLLGVPGLKELDRGHSGRQGLGEFDRRHSSRLGLGESSRRPTDKRRLRESRWDRPPGQGLRVSDRGHSNAIEPEESHLRMPGLEKSSQFHSRERGIGNSDLFNSCAQGLRDSEWSNSRVPGAAESASSRTGNYSSALALSRESQFLGSNMHHHRGVGSSLSVPSLENFNVDHLRESIPDHSDRKRFRETGTGFADRDCYRGQQFVGLDQTDLCVAGPVGLGLVHSSETRFAAPESRHSHETKNEWASGDNGRTERDRGDARGRATGHVKERKDDRNRDTDSRQMSQRERRSREKRVWNRERGKKR